MTDPTPTDADHEITPAPSSPLAIIQAVAADPACDVAKLEGLMALQERWEANVAKANWAEAMAGFQADCPIIPKRVMGDKAKFAPLEDIWAIASPLLRKHGLSVSFSSEPAEADCLHIVCHIAHGTHTETRDFTCPVPGEIISKRTGGSVANALSLIHI